MPHNPVGNTAKAIIGAIHGWLILDFGKIDA